MRDFTAGFVSGLLVKTAAQFEITDATQIPEPTFPFIPSPSVKKSVRELRPKLVPAQPSTSQRIMRAIVDIEPG